MAWAARPNIPALAVGCVTLTDALAARWLLRADAEHVFVLGRPVEWVCALRSQFGLPCPTCGLTRSVVMSLHGEFAQAWKVAPVGPVAVAGVIAFAVAMLVLAWPQTSGHGWERAARLWIRKVTVIYAAGMIAIWLGGWAIGLHAALGAQ